MFNEHNDLLEFGQFRLDAANKFLWHKGEPVDLPLKALELFCLLVQNEGSIVSKTEIWHSVWQDSFVEETNLTHNIYLIRKAFKELGEADPIQTIPRRGYRFAGELRTNGKVILERRAITRTLIEEVPHHEGESIAKTASARSFFVGRHRLAAILAGAALLVVIGLGAWQINRNSAATEQKIRSVAVLPFVVLNGAPSNEHEGIGLTDILITRLSSIKALSVRPTSAVLNLAATNSIEAGEKLGVDAVLEGTIYRTNDAVRITARLIRLNDGIVIWVGQFEKPSKNELGLQNEISLQVAETLAINLDGGQRNALAKSYTESSDAWQTYSKARFEWNKRTWSSMLEAQRLFRNAIAIDPNFALAYSGLADTMATGADATEAESLVNKALELDPDLAEAHASRGFIRMFHFWDWDAAESSLKRSIELNSNYATAHHWYATLHAIKGRNDEAKAEMMRALEINPISPNFLADMGQLHYFAREYDAAKDYCRKALELNPDFVFAHEYLHDIYLMTGEHDKAVESELAAQRINLVLTSDSTERRRHLETDRESQRRLFLESGIAKFEQNLTRNGSKLVYSYISATRYAFLGDKENAIKSLGKSHEDRSFFTVFVKADPVFDPIRNELRFQAILNKMALQ